MKLEHETLGSFEVEHPLKNRHVEAFWEYIMAHDPKGHSGAYSNRIMVEAANEAGILKPAYDANEGDPKTVYWLAGRLIEHVTEAQTLPKN